MTLYSAFSLLRSDYKSETSLIGYFSGKLYLKGIGDPILSADNYDKIANNLAALGIRKIDGNLVLDDTSFDSIALGPGWMIDDEDKYFEAQISALTLFSKLRFQYRDCHY